MAKLDQQYYFVRTSISHHYDSGSGAWATPKLYTKNGAEKSLRYKQSFSVHPLDGPWEMIPVTFILGAPVEHV